MRRRVIQDVETFIAAIQDEISHHPEGRYFHRLHHRFPYTRSRYTRRRLGLSIPTIAAVSR